MSFTPKARGYGWALQTDYVTPKAIANGNFKQLIAADQNFLKYQPNTQDNEAWATQTNSPTDQWIESHDARVSHTVPGFSQELGKIFYLNGQYSVATPGGGTLSRDHTFKPTDPSVTRQDKAVSYVEQAAGGGWNVLAPSMVSDGWSLKGDGLNVLMCDVNLVGSGVINTAPGTTWYPTATPTVTRLTSLHKLFNSQVGLVCTDSLGATTYACRYRSFQFDFKKTMLDAAGMSPGCALFLTSGDPTTGAIRGSHEFDTQQLDFTLTVDMASGSPELAAVQTQKLEAVVLTVTGGIIEGAIRHKMILTVPTAKYKTADAVVGDGIMQVQISGKALFDFTTGKLFDIVLTNDVTTYATAF